MTNLKIHKNNQIPPPPGAGGWHLIEHWVEVCRRCPQTLTLFKTQTKLHAHFNTPLKTRDLILIPYISLREISSFSNKYRGLNSFGKNCLYYKCGPLISSLHVPLKTSGLLVQEDTVFKTLNSEIVYPV